MKQRGEFGDMDPEVRRQVEEFMTKNDALLGRLDDEPRMPANPTVQHISYRAGIGIGIVLTLLAMVGACALFRWLMDLIGRML